MVASQLNGDKMSLRHRYNDEMKYEAADIYINFLIADATPATTRYIYTRIYGFGSQWRWQQQVRRTRDKLANGNCSRTRTKYNKYKRVHCAVCTTERTRANDPCATCKWREKKEKSAPQSSRDSWRHSLRAYVTYTPRRKYDSVALWIRIKPLFYFYLFISFRLRHLNRQRTASRR